MSEEKKKQVVYISGPITGIEDNNRFAFNEAANGIRDAGYEPINPIELDAFDKGEMVWSQYLRRDIPEVLRADLIAVLPGWERSKGASLEVYIARQIGIPIVDAEKLQPLKGETILEEADRIVNGDRRNSYGSPAKNFGRTASIWSGILDVAITPEQVALCMIGLKIAREVHKPSRDNLTDQIGYILCLENILKEKASHNV